MTGKFKVSCIGLLIVMSGFGGLFLMSQTVSGTEVSGNIAATATWNTAGSPYYIIGDLTVNAGISLEIVPDTGPVDVIFNGSYNIWVQGNLYVNGSQANAVTFRSNQAVQSPNQWGTITSQAPGGMIDMNNSVIAGGNNGLRFETDNNTVKNMKIFNCTTGIYLNAANYNRITDNTIENGTTGVYLLNSDWNTLSGNDISEQDNAGLALNNARNNTAENQEFYRCGIGFTPIGGISVSTGSRDNYFANSSFTGNHFGVDIYLTSMWNTVYNCSFSGNNYGMRIWQSSHNNTVVNNTFYNHPDYAMDLNGAVDNVISGNTFENATNRGIYIEGVSIRNDFTENTIINNPNYGIEILATANNNSIYNNNFFNNSIHAYDANGHNYWNQTYSQSPLQGGNYWDNYTGLDEFHGPLQNIAGGDLIGDTNYTWIGGGNGANDSYPLMEPFGGVPPVSSVNATAAWYNSAAVITAAASDVGSGVSNVSLWYRYSADGATWGAWTNYGLNNTGSWSWNFTFPDLDGYYEFYSIAVDRANYTEAAPASADQNCGYDNGAPTSVLDALPNYLQSTLPLTVNGTAADALSGLSGVTLWYRFSADNSTWGSWTAAATDSAANWSWDFNYPDGGGYYEFYSIASDTAGNDEAAPTGADISCRFDNTLPTSSVDVLSRYWFNYSPAVINASASDDSGTTASVSLHYQYSGDNSTWGSWTVFGTDTAAPWSWSFDFPDGQGYYRFYSKAVDGTGNVEPDAAIADETCGYDSIAPASDLKQPANYWWKGNISNNVLGAGWNYSDNLSGVVNGIIYYQHSADNNTWNGWNTGSSFSLGQGYYRFCSRAFDSAGNWEDYPATADMKLAYDAEAPGITDGTAVNVTAGQGFTFTATVTDNMALKGVQISYNLGGNQTNVTMALVSGNYQSTITIPDGAQTLTYRIMAYDQAGNWQVLTEKSVTINQPDIIPDDNPQEFPWMIVIIILVISMAAVLGFLFMRKKPEQMVEEMDRDDGYEDSDEVEEEAEEMDEELGPDENLEEIESDGEAIDDKNLLEPAEEILE